ncbi:MAG: hypothetical protein OJF52_003752 [Nitrospira sp.]|nr:MAG: hypothetical protein OJF52_003752 [Nitrospira sp.]
MCANVTLVFPHVAQLAERARSECARSMRAVKSRLIPLFAVDLR